MGDDVIESYIANFYCSKDREITNCRHNSKQQIEVLFDNYVGNYKCEEISSGNVAGKEL